MDRDESNEDIPPFTPTSTSVGIDDSSSTSYECSFYRDDGEREPLSCKSLMLQRIIRRRPLIHHPEAKDGGIFFLLLVVWGDLD